jgi:hypothetical protein
MLLPLSKEEIRVLDEGLFALQNRLARDFYYVGENIEYYNKIMNIRVRILKMIEKQTIYKAFRDNE